MVTPVLSPLSSLTRNPQKTSKAEQGVLDPQRQHKSGILCQRKERERGNELTFIEHLLCARPMATERKFITEEERVANDKQ